MSGCDIRAAARLTHNPQGAHTAPKEALAPASPSPGRTLQGSLRKTEQWLTHRKKIKALYLNFSFFSMFFNIWYRNGAHYINPYAHLCFPWHNYMGIQYITIGQKAPLLSIVLFNAFYWITKKQTTLQHTVIWSAPYSTVLLQTKQRLPFPIG